MQAYGALHKYPSGRGGICAVKRVAQKLRGSAQKGLCAAFCLLLLVSVVAAHDGFLENESIGGQVLTNFYGEIKIWVGHVADVDFINKSGLMMSRLASE